MINTSNFVTVNVTATSSPREGGSLPALAGCWGRTILICAEIPAERTSGEKRLISEFLGGEISRYLAIFRAARELVLQFWTQLFAESEVTRDSGLLQKEVRRLNLGLHFLLSGAITNELGSYAD